MAAQPQQQEAPLPRQLDTRWTRNLTDATAKKDFEIIVRNSTLLLTRLKEIIEEAEKAEISQSGSYADFEDPNWSHKQAFRNGSLSQLKKLKDLIPF